MNDFRFAIRSLLKTPGFSIVAILTLALGIGANTAIFSLMNDLFLRGLPFERPAEIVRVYGEAKERNLNELPFSVPRFTHFRENDATKQVFTEFAADAGAGFALTGLGDAVQIGGARVTANYFPLLGVAPLRGRQFRADEEADGNVALVTESFCQNRLAGETEVLGRSITLNGVPHTIVGVLPAMPLTWWGPNTEVFTTQPFNSPGLSRETMMRGVSFMRGIGRLRPGVSMEQALAAMQTVQESYRVARPDNADNTWAPAVVTAAEDAVGDLRPAFLTLLVAVGCVLLIACSNVANLLLARFSSRRREIAVRVALGADRRSVIRLFLAESLLVSVIAGVAGLLLAVWTLEAVPALASDNLPITPDARLDPAVLIFTIGLALLTGLAMGIYPALQSSRTDVVDGLKDGGRAMAGSAGQQHFRRALLGVQVGLSLVLLVGAVLLIASFVRLQEQPSGFRHDHTWLGFVNLPAASYPDGVSRERFAERLLAELTIAPGIESAAAGQGFPLSGANSRSPYSRAEGDVIPLTKRPLGLTRSITPDYLKTFAVPLIAGRNFNERDLGDKPLVVLISQAAARKLYPNEDPLGRRLYFGTQNGTGELCEIVGVVGDVRSFSLAQENDAEFYRPWSQRNFPFLQIAARTSGDPAAATATIRAVLQRLDPNVPINQPTTMEEVVAGSLGQQRLMMSLLGIFAGLALLLAVVGIYSLVAYSVGQRTPEIGIRLALGATPRDVLALMIGQGMKPILVGLAAGLIAAIALGNLIASQLYEISARDPVTLFTAAFALGAVALIACWLPARRATRVDPMTALRAE
jgi:predicted permease